MKLTPQAASKGRDVMRNSVDDRTGTTCGLLVRCLAASTVLIAIGLAAGAAAAPAAEATSQANSPSGLTHEATHIVQHGRIM